MGISMDNETRSPNQKTGILQDEISWDAQPRNLLPNETIITRDSADLQKLNIGDNLTFTITLFKLPPSLPAQFNFTLRIVDIVDVSSNLIDVGIPEQFFEIFGIQIPLPVEQVYNLLIVNWTSTLAPLIQATNSIEDALTSPWDHGMMIWVNRNALIDPYDVESSITRVDDEYVDVKQIAFFFDAKATNSLSSSLQAFSSTSSSLIASYFVIMIPVFFISWYAGTTISDVTFNLRRKEIGLLQTRGVPEKRINRMFLVEAALLGAGASLIGLLLASIIVTLFISPQTPNPLLTLFLTGNPTTLIISLIFGIIITVTAVYRPAKRAANMDTLDALKQFVPVEESGTLMKIAFPAILGVLGLLKIIMWILQIDSTTLLIQTISGNFIIGAALAFFTIFDLTILNTWGPVFFLYGFTRLALRKSVRFQEIMVNAGSRFLGPFGKLASTNVKRNPARNAAFVFIISLIVAFGVSSVGILESNLDQAYRTTQLNIGGDGLLYISHPDNVSSVIGNLSNISEIEEAIAEYRFDAETSEGTANIRVMGNNWSQVAYFEESWFVGNSVAELQNELNTRNSTIILSSILAQRFDLDIHDNITIRIDDIPHKMEVIGFVGAGGGFLEGFLGDAFVGQFLGDQYWSYVSEDFFNETYSPAIEIETRILVDFSDGVNSTDIVNEIQANNTAVTSVASFDNAWNTYLEDPYVIGVLRVQVLGVATSWAIASLGTLLIVLMTLQERNVEIALLSIRGLRKKETAITLLSEIIILSSFGLMLGVLTGMIWTLGSVGSSISQSFSLVIPRLVPSLTFIISTLGIIFVIVLSILLPILYAIKSAEDNVDLVR
jgi:putative ABC transport system permease protein